MYRIIITKFEPNPNHEAEYAEYSKNRIYNNFDAPRPLEEFEKKALETVLTDEEFCAVKKACLEIM